jgi:hypothetical protein
MNTTIWAAGFFDGEGSINIVKQANKGGNTNYALVVDVSQVDPRPLEILQKHWRGSLRTRPQPNPKWKTPTIWTVRSIQAEQFLRDIRPYLIVKGEEADVALRFREIKSQYIQKESGRGSAKDLDAFNAREALKNELELIRRL